MRIKTAWRAAPLRGRGTIAIQCLLESKRYPDVDTATPSQHLATATEDLRRLLAKFQGI